MLPGAGALLVALLVLLTAVVIGHPGDSDSGTNSDIASSDVHVTQHVGEPSSRAASGPSEEGSISLQAFAPFAVAYFGADLSDVPGQLRAPEAPEGDHPPGGGHHHHGGEHGATSLPAVSLMPGSRQVAEGQPEGYLGAVRAAGGRERPD
ncbi:hypothetical protein [Aquipuribacter hungaricus]|uniref:Secreted protein n=1 Tax=Aquipuribacter hungaricus TaxID=545624 RepID=A0ABV7WJ16_9MICO